MACTDGIHTYFFQIQQSSFPDIPVNRRTQYTGIVMQTHSLHFHPGIIQRKTFIRIESKIPEPRIVGGCVNHFSVLQQSGFQFIQVRIFQTPQRRIFYFQISSKFKGLIGRGLNFITASGNNFLVFIQKFIYYGQSLSGRSFVFNLNFNVQCVLIFVSGRIGIYTPLSNVYGI